MSRILISTTNDIPNAEIIEHKGLFSAHVVIGTNFLSDFGASFTDVFGGYSSTYRNKLQKIYDAAISELEYKALKSRCNAIIGLRLDFSEISGKGKSMFMVSSYGTGVVVKSEQATNEISENVVTLDELQVALTLRDLVNKISNINYFYNESIWEKIMFAPSIQYADTILKWHIAANGAQPDESVKTLQSNIVSYFESLDANDVVDYLYNNITLGNRWEVSSLLQDLRLFSPSHIIKLLQDNKVNEAIASLSSTKEKYSKHDLESMRTILSMFDNLPDKGKVEEVHGKLSRSVKTKYICQDGHVNDVSDTYCNTCGVNIKGIRASDKEDLLHQYRFRIFAIKNYEMC